MQQKLVIARAEAEAATRQARTKKPAAPTANAPAGSKGDDTKPKGQVAGTKRTAIPKRVGGRAKRRSTLSPEELEELMSR